MKRALALALLASACGLLLTTQAGAAYEPLASGQTKLHLDKSFLAALKREGVTLTARAPARLKAGTVSFPIAGGKLDPTTENGTVEHEGALVFQAGKSAIPLKELQLKTSQKRSPLSAKVGGSQLKIATAKDLQASRSGFGERISVSGLTLSAKLATRLAKKLDRRELFKAGMSLGRATSEANPETIAVAEKNRAELTLAPDFQAKLNSLFVAVNPVFPAEHPGPFTLPIFGGTIAPDASLGTLETQGSLEFLQLGGGQVFWRDPWIDLATRAFAPEAEILPSPPYAGKQERASVAAFAPTAAAPNAKARTISVAGALYLDAATAATFNEVFAKPLGRSAVFVAGEAFGTIFFTAQGQ
jgi:hypothetical protein